MNSLVSKTARNDNSNNVAVSILRDQHKLNESNAEIQNLKGSTMKKAMNRDLSSSENIMVGLANGANGPSDIGPSSPKGKSKVARKISSKNVMSSKQAEQLHNSQFSQKTSPSYSNEAVQQTSNM